MLDKTLSLGFKDITSLEVILFVLKIGFVSIFSWLLVLYFYWSELLHIVSSYLSFIPWDWLKTTGASIITLLIGYILIIITLSILTSIYSEPLLKKLALKRYNRESIGSPNIIKSLIVTIKSTLWFLLLFIILLPTLFIPIIGQIILLYLYSILLKEPIIYDVGSLFIEDKNILKSKSNGARSLSMIASLLNYIPILNIFAPIYAQILFLHHILNEDNL
ncbi:Probable transmembrane protein [hydrothermal vent metagenome]|uniref:Probable transmembrane protein n=1 Tax=hydrothermal vent metagenome TaxID=652676 RepID=A0A1W1EKN9_9ZZZZ